MPTLATGNNRRGRARQVPCGATCNAHTLWQSGFTLVEILVALVILGVLAGAVAITLPDETQSRERQAVEGLAAQAAWASLQAEVSGEGWAWGIAEAHGRVWQDRPIAAPAEEPREEARWTPVEEGAGAPIALPAGLQVRQITVEGLAQAVDRPIRFSSLPTVFVLVLQGHGRQWRIIGRASGLIGFEDLP